MASLRNIVSTNSGMRFMVESLDICSAAGRRMLLSQEMFTNAGQIENELEKLAFFVEIVKQEKLAMPVESIRHDLQQLHDIQGTLANLAAAKVLDDIGFFEIKHFSLLSESVRVNLELLHCHLVNLPILQEVIAVLDPENQKLPQFYIYPAYSQELAELRKQQQNLMAENPGQAEIVRQKCLVLEDNIRQKLSINLFSETAGLMQAHEMLAAIDILFAKAIQAVANDMSRPQPASECTHYTQLFNPWVKKMLEQQQKAFQPVDITIEPLPCLITGANMGGKTVLLKTVALAQYLFQFGFYIPAKEASIIPVDEILINMGDDQSELNGLSSFAAEMLNINKMLRAARTGKKLLALVDEPARTTNPAEGRAIVNAIVTLLAQSRILSLVTTHYSNIKAPCRKLRVKGLLTGEFNEQITVNNINNYMDYSLLEHDADDVPLEALRIASILGVEDELIQLAAQFLKQNS